MAEDDEQGTANRASSELTPEQQAQAPQTVGGPNEVVGHTPSTEKEKSIEVEVDGRDVIVTIGREAVRLNRHTVPSLQQVLQRAFMEVS
jgi:hypothetical protein